MLLGLALITPPILVRTNLYNRRASSYNEANEDYPFEVASQSFDVVVFGESTGRFDIDPRIVSGDLRLSSINLSENMPFLRLVGELGLDRYLSRNHKPKLLVLAISPSNASLPKDRIRLTGFEGWYALIRHGTPKDAFRAFLRSPLSFFTFWSTVMLKTHSLGEPAVRYSVLHKEVLDGRGYTPFQVSLPLASCPAAPPDQKELVKQHSYIDYFVRKYELRGLKVAVFLTPVPDCNPNLAMFKNSLRGIASNEPYGIARGLFANDQWASHALPQAVPRITSDFVAAIKPLLLAVEPQVAIQKTIPAKRRADVI